MPELAQCGLRPELMVDVLMSTCVQLGAPQGPS